MSAFHYLLSKPALFRLKKDGDKCTRCGDCYSVCDLQIKEIADDVKTPQIMMDDCIVCLKCVAACPEEGALKASFAGMTIFEFDRSGLRQTHGERRQVMNGPFKTNAPAAPVPAVAVVMAKTEPLPFGRTKQAQEAERALNHIIDDFDDNPKAMHYFYDLFRRVYLPR